MSSGFSACHADVIPQEEVERLCPAEFQALIRAIETDEELTEDFEANWDAENDTMLEMVVIEYLSSGDEDALPVGVRDAWVALRERFEAVTGGLTLAVGFHNQDDDGDRYDEVDGVYWHVDGMWQRTPAGERFKGVVESKSYVTFG